MICIKAESSYSKIILKNGHSVLVRKGLNQWKKELKKYSFYRIHQSWIVNLRYIIKYNSAKAVIYLPSMEISVSRRKKSDFEEIYVNFLRRKR